MFFLKKKKKNLYELISGSFVDIHSHLLPGIDDGAKNLDVTIELIKSLSELGIQNFITTPHVLGDIYPNTTRVIKEKLLEVQSELKKKKLNHIHISAAAEYMLDEQFQKLLKAGDILTLKDNYILVEMSYFNPPINLFEVLFEIQLKGYKPILAHPERYTFYHKDFNMYYKLKSAGCLFQLNLLSLSRHYGESVKKITHEIIDKNLYDFVGTDTHQIKHIELLKSIKLNKHVDKIEELISNNQKFYS